MIIRVSADIWDENLNDAFPGDFENNDDHYHCKFKLIEISDNASEFLNIISKSYYLSAFYGESDKVKVLGSRVIGGNYFPIHFVNF